MYSTSLGVNMEAITNFGTTLGSQVSLRSRTNLSPVHKLSRFPLTSNNPGKLVSLKATATRTTTTPLTLDEQESNRDFKKLSPSEWGHRFLSAPVDVSETEALKKEIEILKPIVRATLVSNSPDIDAAKDRILWIYLLVSLGLDFHFEDEIVDILKMEFEKVDDMMVGEDDLYKVSIIFWVFRTYGHNISSDVFKRFKGNNGKFKESLVGNTKGLLSLYEAAHLGTTTDYIMDEALSFTSSQLKSLVEGGNLPSHMSRHIENALWISQHNNMGILVAMEFIRFYDQEDDKDKMLLNFAKLNFKSLQLQYLQELKILTKWYKDLELSSKLPPYFRDRLVECYLFMPGMYIEPEASRARIMMTKYFVAITIHDDTFDRYASISEAEKLADSLLRWDLTYPWDNQPDYIKFVSKFMIETFNDFGEELGSELGGSYRVKTTIEEMKLGTKANLNLAKWELAGQVPSFEEYVEVGRVEIMIYASMAATFMGLEKIPVEDAYEWLKSRSRLLRALSKKARLMNDITGVKDDMARGSVTTGVTCYMKEYGVTVKEALRDLTKMVTDADKIINEEFLKDNSVPRKVLKSAIDLARTVNVSYSIVDEVDGYTSPEGKVKEYITSFLVHPIYL